MKTIIAAPSIYTNDKAGSFFNFGAVLINDGIVVKVGPAEGVLRDNPSIPVEELGAGLLTPGLVNLHHHLYSSFARGWAPKIIPPTNFSEILERVWWHLDEGLSLDDIYYSALVGLCQSILSGVTSVVDHHSSQMTISGSLDKIAGAFRLTDLRGSHCFELSNRRGEEAFQTGLRESLDALARWPYGGTKDKLSAMVGLHASMTLSDDNLKDIANATKHYSPGFHFHLAEDKIDQKISHGKYGLNATHRFAKYGLLNERSLAAHGVHLNKDEIQLLQSSKTNLTLCARSNQNNAVGFARWWEYEGVSTGLGTDGIASDMLHEAKSALYLSRHEKHDPDFGFGQVGDMLLEKNPVIFEKISGMKVGRIAAGYPADLVFWNYNSPTPINADNILGHFLYGLCDTPADSVWVGGNKILSNRKFVNFDYQAILAEARKLSKSLWERI